MYVTYDILMNCFWKHGEQSYISHIRIEFPQEWESIRLPRVDRSSWSSVYHCQHNLSQCQDTDGRWGQEHGAHTHIHTWMGTHTHTYHLCHVHQPLRALWLTKIHNAHLFAHMVLSSIQCFILNSIDEEFSCKDFSSLFMSQPLRSGDSLWSPI